MKTQQEIIEVLKCKMDEEGFDYCFQDYSDWTEVEDKKFHLLRQNYINAANELREYIENL